MQPIQPGGPYVTSRPPTWLWALPVFSCGILAVVSPIVIAAKARSSRVWAWTGALTGAWLLGFLLVGTQPDDSDSFLSDLGATIVIAAWIGCVVFALVMGPKVHWPSKTANVAMMAPMAPFPPVFDPNSAAVADVQARRRKQQEARVLARQDPRMARDLRIGRPDLPRQYDDGGLVDVNSAPAGALTQWLGLSSAQAAQVVAAREHLGRFEHVEDLVNLAALDPGTHDQVKDRVILL